MKKYIISIVFLLSIMFSYAYNFTVFGYITNTDGEPVAEQGVFFRVGEPAGSDTTFVLTDEDGYYSVDFELDGGQVIFIDVYSWECNQFYSEIVQTSEAGSQQVDFTICEASNSDCFAFFYYDYDFTNPFLINFNSFVDPPSEETVYTWDFGDGTIGNGASPTHEYETTGEYNVTLTASNDECGEMIYEDFVFLYNDTINFERCFADFYYYIDSIDTNKAYFVDMSWSEIGVTSWNWNFGDGNSSNEQYPEHVYAQEGEYNVSLTIESGDICTSTIEYPIWVGENTWYPDECQAMFFTEYNWDNYLTADFVDFSWGSGNSNIDSWQWDFGDGNGSAEQNPSHTYSEDGEYMVSLTIFAGDCSNTFYEVVYIEDWGNWGDCQAFFFPSFDSTSLNVQFYDLSIPDPDYWNWTFGDGGESTEQNPIHEYDETGIYLISLTSGIGDCASTFEMEIEIRELEVKNTVYEGIIRKAYAVPIANPSSTEDIDKNIIQYSIYPNPVNDELNIDFGSQVDAKISIVSVTGQELKRIEISGENNLRADVSNLPNGIYFAKIKTETKMRTVKFVKK